MYNFHVLSRMYKEDVSISIQLLSTITPIAHKESETKTLQNEEKHPKFPFQFNRIWG